MLLQSDFTVDFFLELCGFFVHLKFLFSISQCSNKLVYTSGWVFLESITVLNIEQTITWMCKSEENQSLHFPIKSQITDLGEIPNYWPATLVKINSTKSARLAIFKITACLSKWNFFSSVLFYMKYRALI